MISARVPLKRISLLLKLSKCFCASFFFVSFPFVSLNTSVHTPPSKVPPSDPSLSHPSLSLAWSFLSIINPLTIIKGLSGVLSSIASGFQDNSVKIFSGYFLTIFFLIVNIVESFQLQFDSTRVVLSLYQDSRYIVVPPPYLPPPTTDSYRSSGPVFSVIPPLKMSFRV